MMHEVVHHYGAQPVTIAHVREITTEHPWKWLSAGWNDIKTSPGRSLTYGLVLTLTSFVISFAVLVNGLYFLLPQLLAGFFLLAPLLGIGVYVSSRQLEAGEIPSFRAVAESVSANSFNIFSMGLVLVVSLIAWVTLAHLIVALTFTGITPASWQGFLVSLFGTWDGFQMLALGISCGAVIAFLIFSVSAISIPMLIDSDCNLFDAIQTSWSAVRFNLLPMFLWGVILVAIIAVSFMTLFVGLIIGFPLAAHATWHAYRDLVEKTH